jgi:hypothetical protein
MFYEHTQPGTVMRAGLISAMVLILITLVIGRDTPVAVYGLLAALGVLTWLFWSLTVQIDNERVMAAFGPGYIRREFPIASIRSARIGRAAWYNGWGVRLTRRGWMYRVSGMRTVDLELPGFDFRIGTDDPEGLLAAIQSAMAAQRDQ